MLNPCALAAPSFLISFDNITFRVTITWLTRRFHSCSQRHWDFVPFSYVPLRQSFGIRPFSICLGPGEASNSMGLEVERSLVLAFHGEALLAWSPRQARLGLELVGNITTLFFDPTALICGTVCNPSLLRLSYLLIACPLTFVMWESGVF